MNPGMFDQFLPRRSGRGEHFAPLPVCWPILTDAETGARLDELTDWTSWLLERYTLDYRTIPPCWAEHGALVEELSASTASARCVTQMILVQAVDR
jgi:hypothetical protein